MKPLALAALFVCAAVGALAHAGNSPEHSADVTITGHIFQPAELPPPPLSQLHVPDGFTIERYAENLGNPRILAVSQAGNIYVTRRETGDVMLIRDDGHGHAKGEP